MQMGPKEIAVEYRTAVNKTKQIKVLAELNQCAERKIAEILVQEGEELPKVYQDKLQKPERRSRKFPDGESTPEADAPAPVETPSVTAAGGGDSSLKEGAKRATDRDLFDAVATLLPDAAPVGADIIRPEPEETAEVPVAPGDEDDAVYWVDGVGPVATPSVTAAGGGSEAGNVARSPRVGISLKEGAKGITAEKLLRAACCLLGSALALSPDEYHTYSCGVLDLVHALTEE